MRALDLVALGKHDPTRGVKGAQPRKQRVRRHGLVAAAEAEVLQHSFYVKKKATLPPLQQQPTSTTAIRQVHSGALL